jgi:hypothetical protein
MNNPNQEISIITINLNNYIALEKTINNIRELKKNNNNIEYIVVDGNSNDKSQLLIMNNLNVIDKYIIEEDNGVYDAMSKGIKIASYEFIAFLNSGDIYLVDNYLKLLNSIDDKTFCYSGRTLWSNNINPGIKILEFFPFLLRLPGHQSMIFPKLFLETYPFDSSFPVSADIDHKLIAYKLDKLKRFDYPVVINEPDGLSQKFDSLTHLMSRSLEKSRIALKHFGIISAIINFCICFIWHGRKLILK